MKIKTTKQMRLDELLKYAWDNEIDLGCVVSDDGRKKIDLYSEGVSFEQLDNDRVMRCHTFAVPTEKELTEHTVFDELHEYFWDLEDGLGITEIHTNESISGIQEEHDGETVLLSITVRIKADNEPTLIWSKDTGIPAEGVIEV